MTSTDGYGGGSIITPEAVLLDFELAGLGSRSLAYAIDLAAQLGALFALLTAVGFVAAGSELAALITLLVGAIVVVLGYPTAMETFNGGRTLGRLIVKTRVVTVEGAPVRFRQAFLRALLGILDLLATAGGIAVVSSLVTKRGQRLGDLVAGTMVIRESTGAGNGEAIHFWAPHYLTQWAQTVDTRALGNDAYQMVRDFLTRTDLVEPTRSMLAEELCVLVSERLPHAAKPPTVPAFDYLTAIATATQVVTPAVQPPPPVSAPNPYAAPVASAPVQAQPYQPQPQQPQTYEAQTSAPQPQHDVVRQDTVQPTPPTDGGFSAPG